MTCLDRTYPSRMTHARMQQMTNSTILCPGCKIVAYCSATCSTVALRTWHEPECLDPSSGAPLELAMSGISSACRVALRAFRRARPQDGPQPNEEVRKDEEVGNGPSTCTATAVSTTTAAAAAIAEAPSTCTAGSRSVSPTDGDGCDMVWPTVKLSHLQEHYIARSARERELLGTEAAVAAVLALGSSGGNGGGAKPVGQEGCELLAAELVETLFKVRSILKHRNSVTILRRRLPSNCTPDCC